MRDARRFMLASDCPHVFFFEMPQARARILSVLSSKLRLSGDFDFSKVAHKTPGFVGADLHALVKEAAVLAINRIFQSLYLPRSQQSVENPDKGGMDVDGEVQDGEVQSASQDHHLLANRVQVRWISVHWCHVSGGSPMSASLCVVDLSPIT